MKNTGLTLSLRNPPIFHLQKWAVITYHILEMEPWTCLQSRPAQWSNGSHFAGDNFKPIGGHVFNLIQIHWSLVPKHQLDKKTALVQVMAGRQTGKSLHELMITKFRDVILLPQWTLGAMKTPLQYYVKTTPRRRFDVTMTLSLRHVSIGFSMTWPP